MSNNSNNSSNNNSDNPELLSMIEAERKFRFEIGKKVEEVYNMKKMLVQMQKDRVARFGC